MMARSEAVARILSGRGVADEILSEARAGASRLAESGLKPPRLAAVRVGEDPASAMYVRTKIRTCSQIGFDAEEHRLEANLPQEDLLRLVADLNRREEVDGILIQMPLPPSMEPRKVLAAVDPDKDVDGFHPVNVGRLWQGEPAFAPCTPAGIVELLERGSIPIEGRQVVVVGRSDIVGKPMAALLLHRHATVTICHSRTSDLRSICARADILVAAMGKKAFIREDFIRPGAVVVDVGIHQVHDPAEASALFDGEPERLEEIRRKGYTLVGDVHPAEARRRAGALTPVPGGVGPLTIAHLMRNTLRAAERRRGRR